jgi:hypothetical protein
MLIHFSVGLYIPLRSCFYIITKGGFTRECLLLALVSRDDPWYSNQGTKQIQAIEVSVVYVPTYNVPDHWKPVLIM